MRSPSAWATSGPETVRECAEVPQAARPALPQCERIRLRNSFVRSCCIQARRWRCRARRQGVADEVRGASPRQTPNRRTLSQQDCFGVVVEISRRNTGDGSRLGHVTTKRGFREWLPCTVPGRRVAGDACGLHMDLHRLLRLLESIAGSRYPDGTSRRALNQETEPLI